MNIKPRTRNNTQQFLHKPSVVRSWSTICSDHWNLSQSYESTDTDKSIHMSHNLIHGYQGDRLWHLSHKALTHEHLARRLRFTKFTIVTFVTQNHPKTEADIGRENDIIAKSKTNHLKSITNSTPIPAHIHLQKSTTICVIWKCFRNSKWSTTSGTNKALRQSNTVNDSHTRHI